MNILFISHYEKLYGANRSLLLLLDGLIKKNINPFVIIPRNGPFADELRKRRIQYKIIYFKPWMGIKGNLFYIKVVLRLLVNLIALPVFLFYIFRFKPSVIYSNSSVTPIGIYLSLISGIPHVWHVRELGKPDYNLGYDFGKKYFLWLMKKSVYIIAISEFVKREVFPGEWGNLIVINNAVIFEGLTDNANKHRNNDTITFTVMSIIHPSKGIEDAIKGINILNKEIQNIKLLIYGGIEDKSYKASLDNMINELGLQDKVFFKGYTDKPFEAYQVSDAVLICSRSEAWGRVAAEAMISGIPVIGYNSGGTKEIIIDKFNGLLYNNAEELAECMKAVISDKELINKLVLNAKNTASENFSPEIYTSRILNVINNAASVKSK